MILASIPKHRRILSPLIHTDYPSRAKCDCDKHGAHGCPRHDPTSYARVWSEHRATR